MIDGGSAESEPDKALTIGELLTDEVLDGAELIAGFESVSRPISAVNVMSVPEIGKWVRHGQFLLATGYPLPRDDDGQAQLVRDLHRMGVAGIGIKLDRYMPELSQQIIATASDVGMPLVIIPERMRFDDILSRAFTIIVNRQASALALTQEIHGSFLEITLAGGGLAELARRLSGLVGDASVVIADLQGAVLSIAGDEAVLTHLALLVNGEVDVARVGQPGIQDDGTGTRWAAREIRAGNLHHGYVIVAKSSASFGDLSLVAVDQAAIVAALEVTRDLAVAAVERRFSSNALFELITGSQSEFADAATRGFGWDVRRDVVVMVARKDLGAPQARHDPPSKWQSRGADDLAIEFWVSAVRSQDRKAAAAGLGSELVAVIGADRNVMAAARSVQAEIAQFTSGHYAIGVSRTHAGPTGISVAYEEARLALRLGHRLFGTGALTAYDDLGLFRLLAQVGDEELLSFAEETLGPLMRLNEAERSEMLRTLVALVEHNMNMAETARHLHFHYNTMRYRLTKLERLLGPFSTSTPVTIRVCVALQILEMRTHLVHRLR